MHKLILTLIFIFVYHIGFSQNEVSNWYFSANQYLKFVGDTAEIVDLTGITLFISRDNNSCISNSNGDFLFFSNGEVVFNSNLDTLNNITLTSSDDAAQNIIIPKPGNNNRFYVFVPGHWYAGADFRYTELDLSLNSGMGGVVPYQSNIYLSNNVSEKVTAVYHANGKDIWVITHQFNSNNFLSYLVTEQGVNSIPIISSVGTIHQESVPPPAWLYDSVCKGEIKTSTDGRYVAIASKGLSLVELFDFDNETGILSNPISFDIPAAMCLEFSSDGNVLYASNETSTNPTNDTTRIFQINLLAGTPADIINSTIAISGTPPGEFYFHSECPLQLAYNDKIYFGCQSTFFHANYGALYYPHLLDSIVHIEYNEVTWPNSIIAYYTHGLPNFFRSFLDKNIFATTVCFGDTTMLWTKNRYLFDSIRWEITDPLLGLYAYSNLDTVFHQFSQPGNYNIHCFRYRDSYVDDFIKKVQVMPFIEIFGSDTTLCEGEETQLIVNSSYCDVSWYNYYTGTVTNGSILNVTSLGMYWPIINNFWGTCGDPIDTFQVDYITFSLELGPDIYDICETTPVTLVANPSYALYVQWSTGETTWTIDALQSGLYEVTISNNLCEAYDDILITYDEELNISLGQDIISCEEDSVLLSISALANEYLWSPGGQMSQSIYATLSDSYIGAATNVCGTFTDTINVSLLSEPNILPFIDTSYCLGDSVAIDISIELGEYLWSDGSTEAIKYFSFPGLYNVTVNNECGTAYSEINISEDYLLELNLEDSIVLATDSILIELILEANFLWSTGSLENYIWATDTGLYTVTVTNSCNSDIDSIYVTLFLSISDIEQNKIIIFPNPVSDELYISGLSGNETLSLRDLLGKELFFTDGVTLSHTVSKKINLSHLPYGVYLLMIEEEGQVRTFKVVKE